MPLYLNERLHLEYICTLKKLFVMHQKTVQMNCKLAKNFKIVKNKLYASLHIDFNLKFCLRLFMSHCHFMQWYQCPAV